MFASHSSILANFSHLDNFRFDRKTITFWAIYTRRLTITVPHYEVYYRLRGEIA